MIETEELLIRHVTKQDRESFTTLVTKPAFGQFSPFGNLTIDNANQIIDKIISIYEGVKKVPFEFWSVIEKKNNTYAGFVGYQPVVFETKAEQMYFIGFNRKFWGTQIPLKSTVATCKFAFNGGAIERLIAFIHPDDVESIYIAQTLGYHFEKECPFFDATFLLFSLVSSQMAQTA